MTLTTLTLATTTSVLAYDGPPHTDAWYAARQSGITATDLVKIMGLSKYGTATDVWATKRGLIEDGGMSEAAEWGLIHEPAIDKRWSQQNATTTSEIGVIAHVDYPHHRASLDRLVMRCPDSDGPCGLQIKTRSAFKADDWRRDVPDDVWVQEQWEMHVSGYRHMHVAVLIGGNTMKSFRVNRDDDDIAILIKHAEDVWTSVINGEPPTIVDPTEFTTASLNRLYPNRDGQAVLDRTQADALLTNWLDTKHAETAANRAASDAKKVRVKAEAAMVAALGPAKAAFVGDDCAFSYETVNRDGYAVKATSWQQMKLAPGYTIGATS